jgi:5-amino-6-(5-phospho-D-ribitylamino)uracil phosphatase
MKTLYISDLDGTLLNRQAELSDFARDTLNALIQGGLSFSFATARTAASAVKIMQAVNISLPVILMNGVLIYDWPRQRYSKIEPLGAAAVDAVLGALARFGNNGFMYAIEDGQLTTCYTRLDTPLLVHFFEERRQKYYKSFEQVEDFNCMRQKNTIYCTLVDQLEALEPLRASLAARPDILCTLYPCIYEPGAWYLEIFSSGASKENAVRHLREQFGFDRIVGFGDNLNDLSMFRACDEKYAMRNARAELKAAADVIIGSNDEDGVVRFLLDSRRST